MLLTPFDMNDNNGQHMTHSEFQNLLPDTHKHVWHGCDTVGYHRCDRSIDVVVNICIACFVFITVGRFSSSSWFKRITTQSFDCWSLIFWFFLFHSAVLCMRCFSSLGPVNFDIVCVFFLHHLFFCVWLCWFVTHRGSLFWEYGVL